MDGEKVIELPLWLAKELASQDFVTVLMPTCYRSRVKAAINASPTTVNLRTLNTHFYTLGIKVSGLRDDIDLAGLLMLSFRSRLPEIMDLAAAGDHYDHIELSNTLDETERSRMYIHL